MDLMTGANGRSDLAVFESDSLASKELPFSFQEVQLLLGQLARRTGELDKAAVYFQQAALNGDRDVVTYLRDVFHGHTPAVARSMGQCWPSPHYCCEQVLNDEDAAALLWESISEKTHFSHAIIGTQQQERKIRSALTSKLSGKWERRFGEVILDAMPLALPVLGIPGFEIQRIEFSLICSRNGDFYRPHRDIGHKTSDRRLSFVFYFHQEPKPYQGGDLLLFDTRSDASKQTYLPSAYTRIIPKHNQAVLFPSNICHEVTEVRIPQTDFAFSRFCIAAWVS